MAYRKLPESLLAAVLLSGLVAGSQQAAAANIYRYIDNNGRTVFDARIPVEYVRNGYTILNDRGQVVEVVPPAPTAAELAARAAAEEELRLQDEARRARREADALLTRLYRHPDEIAKKRDDRLGQISVQNTALDVSISKAETEVARLQLVVDNHRSADREPPADTLVMLRVQEEELARLVLQQQRLEEERALVDAEATQDMKRLAELLGLPEPDTDISPAPATVTEVSPPA